MRFTPYPTVTGVILAGGKARRMGGEDKGLLNYQGQALISHVIAQLQPQVDTLLINANRNIDRYQAFGYPVVSDELSDYQGPLAGMLSAMRIATTDYILTAPCDSPSPSPQLRRRMLESLLLNHKTLAVASDGKRLQPVFCLIPCHLADDLAQFLASGERKIDKWLSQHPLAEVDFSDQPACFDNLNHPEELTAGWMKAPVPMLGIAAFSGTGKTTLLKKLLPQLTASGLRVAVIKHAHHQFDIDKPGKDSYEIREAGASQVVVASRQLLAMMQTYPQPREEPQLRECLARLDLAAVDLILVEGFKHTRFAKIELHRSALGKPYLFPEDDSIIAIASDAPVSVPNTLVQLDINDIAALVPFIQTFMTQATHHD